MWGQLYYYVTSFAQSCNYTHHSWYFQNPELSVKIRVSLKLKMGKFRGFDKHAGIC